MKKTVLIDMDGVVADLETSVTDIYQRENPTLGFIPKAERQGMIMQHQYRARFGDLEADTLEKIFQRPGLFANLKPFPQAVGVIKNMLRSERYNIFFCTTPHKNNPTCASDKIAWICKHFGDQHASKVIITNDKTIIQGDYLIDDNEKINGVMREEPAFKRHILCRNNHNRHIKASGKKVVLDDSWLNLDVCLGEYVRLAA